MLKRYGRVEYAKQAVPDSNQNRTTVKQLSAPTPENDQIGLGLPCCSAIFQ
jgi:hypothetical protein